MHEIKLTSIVAVCGWGIFCKGRRTSASSFNSADIAVVDDLKKKRTIKEFFLWDDC